MTTLSHLEDLKLDENCDCDVKDACPEVAAPQKVPFKKKDSKILFQTRHYIKLPIDKPIKQLVREVRGFCHHYKL